MKALMYEVYEEDGEVIRIGEDPDFPMEMISISEFNSETKSYEKILTIQVKLARELAEALHEIADDVEERDRQDKKSKKEKAKE